MEGQLEAKLSSMEVDRYKVLDTVLETEGATVGNLARGADKRWECNLIQGSPRSIGLL